GGHAMNWDAIGSIGQVVSALALLFVLMQIRHAREEMRRAAVVARLHGTRDMFMIQATDERLPSLVERAQAEFGIRAPTIQYFMGLGLTVEDSRRLGAYHMAIWQNFEASFETMRHLSPGVMREVEQIATGNYARNAVSAKWFEMSKDRLNPDAVR